MIVAGTHDEWKEGEVVRIIRIGTTDMCNGHVVKAATFEEFKAYRATIDRGIDGEDAEPIDYNKPFFLTARYYHVSVD